MRIGELLLSEGHLTQDGLEEALDWQVLYGGRLGTNLLELQLVQEERFARALGKQLGCETTFGPIEMQPELIGLLPAHVADRQEMVPWRLDRRRLKVLCVEIKPQQLDALSYKLNRPCVPVVAPEFRIFNLLRAHYGAVRQMRALDFGVVPEEGREERRRRKAFAEHTAAAPPTPELIDESAFNDIYNRVLAGRGPAPRVELPAAAAAPPPPSSAALPSAAPGWLPPQLAAAEAPLEALPVDAILEELPLDAIVGEAPAAVPPASTVWDEPAAPRVPARDESPLAFDEAVRLLDGVTDRDEIAHIVLRASRSKAARALLLTVQGGVALGWDGLGEGLSEGRARGVAVPLAAQSAFELVVRTRSHFMGPLRKTPSNIRFLKEAGKQVPLSSLLLPILHRGRVSHLLYLDNGHKQQAPTDVGEMLILSQRIAQSVAALVERKRRGA